MQSFSRLVLSTAMVLWSLRALSAQDLRPRAYVINPVHSNAVILGYAFNDGSVFFGTVLPITNASGQYSVPNFTYYHTMGFFKRSANITATLPYVVGTFQGEVQGNGQQIYRSGMANSIFRCSVNLLGGPAMAPKDFARWKQKTILGASIEVVARPASTTRATWSTQVATGGLSNRNLAIPAGGELDSGWLWRSLAVHHQQQLLDRQRVLPQTEYSDTSPHCIDRNALELRRKTAQLGLGR